MFDMNALFEEAVFEVLNKNKSELEIKNIQSQKSSEYIFNEPKNAFLLKPDIYIEKYIEKVDDSKIKTIIIDTKYKLVETIKEYKSDKKQVSQADVYQMFAYSQYYEAKKCILLYPQFNDSINKSLKSQNMKFDLQILTVDLHLEEGENFREYVKRLKEIVKNNLKPVV